MGVKGLWTILEPISQPCSIDELDGKTIAVDLGFWVCQTNNFEAKNLYMRNLVYRTLGLLAKNVNLIFVLEGKMPEMKNATMKYRLEHSKSANHFVKSDDEGCNRSGFDHILQECQKMLELLGVRCVTSSGEAEALCAQLDLHGVVDGCFTNDSDAFLYGAQVVYRNFSMKKFAGMDKYCMSDVESKLQMDRRTLVSLAIILGCDYLPKGIPGVGKEKAMKFLKGNPKTDLLSRFQQWKEPNFSEDFDARKAQFKNVKHCTKCQHIGLRKDHTAKGCESCHSSIGCLDKGNCNKCLCEWHQNSASEADELEMLIRNQALKVENFPCTQVSEEFLNYKDTWPDDIRKRNRPQYVDMLNFITHRFHWEYDKFFERFSPIMLSWDLYCLETQNSSEYFFKINCILRKAFLYGGDHYELKWEVHDPIIKLPSKNYAVTSFVKGSMLRKILPDLVEQYEAHLTVDPPPCGSIIAARKHKLEEEEKQTKMTDFFKQTKHAKPDPKHFSHSSSPLTIDLT